MLPSKLDSLLSYVCCIVSLFVLSACSCEGASVTPNNSSLNASLRVLNFGRVFVGSSKTLSFELIATGGLPIEYSGSFGGNPAGYVAIPGAGQIEAGGRAVIQVGFRPGREGEARATIRMDSDATDPRAQSVTVELIADGVPEPDCEDGNGCTVDRFNFETERCEHAAERLVCDDLNLCTQDDTCVAGVCLGASVDCDDEDPCTDDFCDPLSGCVNELAVGCDDDDPCTRDTCDPVEGCRHDPFEDGTPCDDFEACTKADICLFGDCVGVAIEDGTECDDQDPCSKNDQCISGECKDPDYEPPRPGELQFRTLIGKLSFGSASNPVIDRNGSVFAGVEGGIAAVDECGEFMWENKEIGTTRWSGALALPGRLAVPVGSQVIDLDASTGQVEQTLDLEDLFAPETGTSSTATVSVTVVDLAARASGALVASVVRTEEIEGQSHSTEGILAEIDRGHRVATVFRRLGSAHASRVAIDRDEALVVVLADGLVDEVFRPERLARFGVHGVPGSTWSTTPTSTSASFAHTEIAIGWDGRVLWTGGLVSVSRQGDLVGALPAADSASFVHGTPIVFGDGVYWLKPGPRGHELTCTSSVGASSWSVETGPAPGMSPAVDTLGAMFFVTDQGRLLAYDVKEGMELLSLPLTTAASIGPALPPVPWERVSVGISPHGTVIAVAQDRVFGVKSTAPLANSPWPRHRRDNLSTGHR